MHHLITLFTSLCLLTSCSSESTSESEPKASPKEIQKTVEINFEGTPEEIGKQLIDHYFLAMTKKDLDAVSQILHAEVVYMDIFKGKEKVVKHLQKTFDNRDMDWLTLKEMRISKATEDEIEIYTLEHDVDGLGIDNYGHYKMVKENDQFKIVMITIPSEDIPEIFQE